MASLATQDLDWTDAGAGEEELNKPQAWGRLFPLSSSFVAFDLLSNNYTFGRGAECDVSFSQSAENNLCFEAYSKIHFRLSRTETRTGFHIFLEDTSSNGTFVNGQKVGKGKKYVLKNNDEISLAIKKNKAYVFMDLNVHENNLPLELTQKYILTSVLGRGTCGEVRLAFAKGSCEKYACKIISKKTFSSSGNMQINRESKVMTEVRILKALKHPCIIGIVDVVDTSDMLYIVLELPGHLVWTVMSCERESQDIVHKLKKYHVEGGELFDKVVSIGKYTEATAKLLFFQIATAVKYLHDEGITHRDLKPENILLASDDLETLIKVTDFGLSKFVDAGSILKTFCGTPTYLAPEVLLTAGSGSYTKAIDCWSLGVILFIMLSGYPPFSDERGDMDLPKQIIGGHYTFPKQYWKDISAAAVDLIKKMLVVDPNKRITSADILNHPWFVDNQMRTRTNAIMYGDYDSMGPLKTSVVKRKAADGCDEPRQKRKPSLDAIIENNQ